MKGKGRREKDFYGKIRGDKGVFGMKKMFAKGKA